MRELTVEQYREKVRRWLRTAKSRGSTHMVVAFDGKRKSPFPVYVTNTQNVQQRIKNLNDDINTNAVEVYNLSKDIESQLLQARAWNV